MLSRSSGAVASFVSCFLASVESITHTLLISLQVIASAFSFDWSVLNRILVIASRKGAPLSVQMVRMFKLLTLRDIHISFQGSLTTGKGNRQEKLSKTTRLTTLTYSTADLC